MAITKQERDLVIEIANRVGEVKHANAAITRINDQLGDLQAKRAVAVERLDTAKAQLETDLTTLKSLP